MGSLATKIQRDPAPKELTPVSQRSRVRPDGTERIKARWFSSTSSPTPDARKAPESIWCSMDVHRNQIDQFKWTKVQMNAVTAFI